MRRNFLYLNTLHILNDGFEASFLLLLPFIVKDLNINLAQVGFLSSAEKIAVMMLSIPSAYIATKFGGMRVITMAIFIYSAAYLLTGFSPSFLFLLISFIIAGIGFGTYDAIGLALATQWSNKNTRGAQMGTYSATGDIGKVIIPAVLTFLIVVFGWRSTTLVFAVIGMIAFIFFLKVFFSIKDSRVLQNKNAIKVPLKSFFTNKLFLLSNVANMFDNIGGSPLYIYIPFLLLDKGVSTFVLGLIAVFYFIGNIFGKMFLGRAVDIFGNVRVLIFSEICMVVNIIFIASASYVPFIIFLALTLGIFTKGTVPIIKTMVAESAAHHENFQKTFGLNVFLGKASTAFGALLLGLIANEFGITVLFYVAAFFSFLVIFPALGFSFVRKMDNKFL